ncbi:phage virion morphogenesis protein [Oryzifoliimicrobium ureilyticus]|uniref:phage virion morphogenesis protein n=1 Tax=Oryzifoliimicrobium ureilyticus TaxID=3113724 RepID=UPI0030766AC9
MTGASITVTDEISPAIERLVATTQNASQIMSEVAGYLLSSTQERFQRETGPDGKKWQALSPRTASARAGRGVRGYDHILRDSVRLYNSLTTASNATTATVGTNVIYAGIHQFGGTIEQGERSQKLSLKRIRGKRGMRFVRSGRKGAIEREVTIGARSITIPARPYLGVNAADEAEIAAIIEAGLERVVQ